MDNNTVDGTCNNVSEAVHYRARELAKYLDVDINDIRICKDDYFDGFPFTFEYDDDRYAVATPEEAEEIAVKNGEELLWAITPSTLVDVLSSNDCVTGRLAVALEELIAVVQSQQCEGCNELLHDLIKGFDTQTALVACLRQHRGDFINSYDGAEIVLDSGLLIYLLE